jgi:hypothetical protein
MSEDFTLASEQSRPGQPSSNPTLAQIGVCRLRISFPAKT